MFRALIYVSPDSVTAFFLGRFSVLDLLTFRPTFSHLFSSFLIFLPYCLYSQHKNTRSSAHSVSPQLSSEITFINHHYRELIRTFCLIRFHHFYLIWNFFSCDILNWPLYFLHRCFFWFYVFGFLVICYSTLSILL